MKPVSTLGSSTGTAAERLTDAALLATITILSALPYVGSLGFYSDDWGLLAGFSALDKHSFWEAASGGFAGRPVQALYAAALFNLFGLNPLGYHLVNSAVLAACSALFYGLLVRLRFGRAQSFASVVLFVMLPQLSTVRVWYASFQVPLSMALMLASMHCQLSIRRRGGLGWLAGAIGSALLSVGAYEIFAPILAGFAVTLVFVRWRASRSRNWGLVAAVAAVAALLLLAFVYKLVASGRAGPVGDLHRYVLGLHQLFRLDYDWRVDSGLNILATPRAYFLAPIVGWWYGAGALVTGRAGVAVTGIAMLIALIVAWRISGAEQRYRPKLLLLTGIAAFVLGNATFLIVPAVVFTSTGMDNRVQVAAAIGVALALAALISFVVDAMQARHRTIMFSGIMALVSAAGFARIAQIERYWAEAPALQQRVLTAARSDLGQLPANSTVILDGICPYHGPAVVFETSWDIAGALTIALGRPVNADAVSERMKATPTGLSTSIYKQPSFYPYGPSLYVYNPLKHLLVRLDSGRAAAAYLGARNEPRCPGYVARGVEV